MSKVEEAQSYIDRLKIAGMGLDFSREFFGIYPTEVFGHMLAVGPMQAYVGLAIKNGHLVQTAEVAELREQLATAHKALEFYRDGFQFTTNKRYGGLEWTPTESLLDDCGNIARSTLIEAERP